MEVNDELWTRTFRMFDFTLRASKKYKATPNSFLPRLEALRQEMKIVGLYDI